MTARTAAARLRRPLALLVTAAALAAALSACQAGPALNTCPQGQVKAGSVMGAAECDPGNP